jgi:hypothetical protein
VVVAPEYRRPLLLTLTVPAERDDRYREEAMVEEELVKNPPRSPRAVEVDTYVPVEVKGQAYVETVKLVPPTRAPGVPVKIMPVPAVTEVVATVPKVEGVPAPVQYARLPILGTEEVDTLPLTAEVSMDRTEGEDPMTVMGLERERGPVAVRVVVATEPTTPVPLP